MGDLMRANLFRLKRDKVFWTCGAALLALSAAVLLNGCHQYRDMWAEGYQVDLARCFFQLIPAMGMCVGIFTGLFLGTDHSEGALRNRLMVGHSRERVYLAGLGASLAGAAVFTLAWLVGSGLPAVLNRDLWRLGPGPGALLLLVAVGSALALASVLTVAGMLCEKKSTAAVASILLVLGLMLVSTWLHARLLEPEMSSGLVITAQGMEWGEPTPNSRYVGGMLRQCYELVLDILPTGQMVLLSDMAVARPGLNLAASLAVTVAAALAGMGLFRKKDLK